MAREQNKYPVQMTRKGVVVSGALVFFVMGWMFVLGILVGRGTAPLPVKTNALEKELNALKTVMQKQDQTGTEAKNGQNQPQTTDLGFYEDLRKAPAEKHYRIKLPTVPVRKAAEQAEAARKKAITAAAVPDPAPTEAKPAVRQARAASPPVPAAAAQPGHFTIQVAAFKDLQSAEQMVAKLRARNYPGYSLRADVQGKGTWFRVRVGAFKNRAAAEKMLARLKGDRFKGIVMGTP